MPHRCETGRFRTVPLHVGLGAALGAAAYLLIVALDVGSIGGLLATEAEQNHLRLTMLGIFASTGAVGSGLTAFLMLAMES